MWRRWAGSREPEISEPTLFETTMEESYLETIPEVDSIKSHRSSLLNLPQLSLRAVPPRATETDYNNSRASAVSSVYSQPDMNHDDYHDMIARSMASHGNVSPISSPGSSMKKALSEKSIVSPVESNFSFSTANARKENLFKSQIPVPKLTHGSAQPKPRSEARKSKNEKTMWDLYSGEPTKGEAGKPSIMRPGAVEPEDLYGGLKERTKLILAGLRERDIANTNAATAKSRWGRTPPPVEAETSDDPHQNEDYVQTATKIDIRQYPQRNISRMEVADHTQTPSPYDTTRVSNYETASSVTSTIESTPSSPTVHKSVTMEPETSEGVNNHAVSKGDRQVPGTHHRFFDAPAPAPAYRPSFESRAGSNPRAETEHNTFIPSTAVSHSPVQQILPRKKPIPDLSLHTSPSEESIRPTVPLKLHGSRSTSISTIVENTATLQSPFESPYFHTDAGRRGKTYSGRATPEQTDEPREMYRAETPTPPATPKANDLTPKAQPNSKYTNTAHMEHEESRFSWTTYATSGNESPTSLYGVEDETNPVPAMPSLYGPVITRRRPVSSAWSGFSSSVVRPRESMGSMVSRKPIDTDRQRSSSAMLLTSKSLPPTPIEMQAGDKISTFEAQLEDLARRRQNNGKIAGELAHRLKKHAIAYDVRKRKEVEKMISSLRLEHDEIVREEHDIGLLLHRAERKRDENDNYANPTGLWIKRVTS